VNTLKFFVISSIFILSACGSDNSPTPESSRIGSNGFVAAGTASPPLQISEQELDAALQCSDGFGSDSGRAVLLVPGATQTVESNFSWNYIPAFDQAGIPWCAVDLPNSNTGELQASSEYITHAIRKMFRTTGTKIAIVGFSQGGVMPRWSLKFFPDTRDMVEEMIGIAVVSLHSLRLQWLQNGLMPSTLAVKHWPVLITRRFIHVPMMWRFLILMKRTACPVCAR
jgi:hypothetical protein